MRLWGEKSHRHGGNVPRSDGFEVLTKLLDRQFPVNATEVNCLALSVTAACKAYRDENPTFTAFPKLPWEIKSMIFEYSLPPPRTVTVYEPSNGPCFILKIDPKTRANAVPTPLLHTCRESREFALKTFQRFDIPSNLPFYFGFKEDTLRVSHDWALKTLCGCQPGHRKVNPREVLAWQQMIRNLSLVGSTSRLDFQWLKNMKALEIFAIKKPANHWLFQLDKNGVYKEEESPEQEMAAVWKDHNLGVNGQLPQVVLLTGLEMDAWKEPEEDRILRVRNPRDYGFPI